MKRRPWWPPAPLILLATVAIAETEWRDSTRDVWIDGRPDRDAQVLVHEDEIAILSAALPWVVVFHVDSRVVSRLDKDDLQLAADRASATSKVAAEPIDGIVETIGDSAAYLVVVRDRLLVVGRHQGPSGEVGLSELWRHVPVWRSLSESHEPDPDVVAALRQVDGETEVTVYLGTWCGDSKRAVPRLIKTLQQTANPGIALRLVALGRGMTEPLELVREQRLTNVPTVVVSQGGTEIGRIVETAAGESFAEDLAAILAGRVADHPGRWKRGDSRARGSYVYTDASGAEIAEERWELWAGEDGGTLIRSRLLQADSSIELWQRRDREGQTEFVEVTRSSPNGHSRTRHWIEDGKLRALTRGDSTGIVDQDLALPEGVVLLLPTAVTAGQTGPMAGDVARERLALQIAGGDGSSAALVSLELSALGAERVETALGSYRAEGVRLGVGPAVSEWWLHPELGIPLAGKLASGVSVTLRELEMVDGRRMTGRPTDRVTTRSLPGLWP